MAKIARTQSATVRWMFTYRGELRDLNESNFARFDAKMGKRRAGDLF